MKEIFKQTLKEMLEIMENKNHDYANTEIDPFFNFTMCEKLGIVSTEKGIIIRMLDKISRVLTLIDKNEVKVKDEKIEDTLKDLANYSILLLCYIKIKNEKK